MPKSKCEGVRKAHESSIIHNYELKLTSGGSVRRIDLCPTCADIFRATGASIVLIDIPKVRKVEKEKHVAATADSWNWTNNDKD